MTPNHDDNLTELAIILSSGFLRVLARKSSPVLPDTAKTLLDCEAGCGGDVDRKCEDFAP